jgi:ribonucleoside-diphosphate reductase beta chain
MSVFDETKYLDSKYNFLDKYSTMVYRSLWTPAAYQSLIEEQDAPYYKNQMKNIDKEAIKRCLLSVAIVEDRVKSFWMGLHKDLPQTIISDVGGLFGAQEVTHRKSYHHLLNVLEIDVREVQNHKPLRDKISYLKKYSEPDNRLKGKRGVLKKLTLFTALTEKASLTPCFYILSSWANSKKGLETISALQKSTAQEELFMHYAFGLDLINLIKEEDPTLWNDYLQELVLKNIKMAYASEVKLISWIFEQGVPEHLTEKEVMNFLNFNFNGICEDLELDLRYPVDEDLYEEKNSWFMVRISGATNGDFFLTEGGNYANEEEKINMKTFKI